MNRDVNAISGRLSLRPPQRRALEILARVSEITSLKKDADIDSLLKKLIVSLPQFLILREIFHQFVFH